MHGLVNVGRQRRGKSQEAASPDALTRLPSSSTALREMLATRNERPPTITCMPRAQWAAVATALRAMTTPLQSPLPTRRTV
jgi:hypothetical protein